MITTWVELLAVTVRIEEPPSEMEEGFAEIVTVGGGRIVTLTVTLLEVVPPGPVAVAV